MKSRIAIITGASSGIGEASAFRFAKKGIRMVLNGRDQKKLRLVQQKTDLIGNDSISRVVLGDISDSNVTEACTYHVLSIRAILRMFVFQTYFVVSYCLHYQGPFFLT